MNTKKRLREQLFSCVLVLGMCLLYPLTTQADTQDLTSDRTMGAAPLKISVGSTYTITIPQKISLAHMATDKQYLTVMVDAKLRDDERLAFRAVDASSDGSVGISNGRDTLRLTHRRTAEDSLITSDDALITTFPSGQTTYQTHLQPINWREIKSGGVFKGNLTYSAQIVKTGGQP